jgi:hypothetical protein
VTPSRSTKLALGHFCCLRRCSGYMSTDLRSAYRAFLHLGAPLKDGAEYIVTATRLNASWNSRSIALSVALNSSAPKFLRTDPENGRK